MRLFKCDRCAKVVNSSDNLTILCLTRGTTGYRCNTGFGSGVAEHEHKDLCDSCEKEFNKVQGKIISENIDKFKVWFFGEP